MTCTCAGTAPGYPMHEDWCGQPETDCLEGCVLDPEHDEPCLTAAEIEEQALKARDYEGWAAL